MGDGGLGAGLNLLSVLPSLGDLSYQGVAGTQNPQSTPQAPRRVVGADTGCGPLLPAQGRVGHSLKPLAPIFPEALQKHQEKPRRVVGSGESLGPGGLSGLFPPCLGSDSTARKEREVMLRLKEVVDKQRDELRAQAHEIVCKSRDTEAVSLWELAGVVCERPGDLLSMSPTLGAVVAAGEPAGADDFPVALDGGPEPLLCLTLGSPRALQLQEQLHRFMSMNEDLRHKVAVVQAQLKSALEKKSDLEAAMLQTQRETSRRSRTSEIQRPKPSLVSQSPWLCCYCRASLTPTQPSWPCVGLLAHLNPPAASRTQPLN